MTPIVVTQLSNTKKHKDELRKARRGSAPKQADVAAAGEKRIKIMMTSKLGDPIYWQKGILQVLQYCMYNYHCLKP